MVLNVLSSLGLLKQSKKDHLQKDGLSETATQHYRKILIEFFHRYCLRFFSNFCAKIGVINRSNLRQSNLFLDVLRMMINSRHHFKSK
ncbi:hypothetical protein BpHYR1_036451, partial [Brachionus plicatilis]